MPKHLLFVDHAQALGGAERSLLDLLVALNRDRWHPYLACPPGVLAKEATSLGLCVHPISLPRLRRSPLALSNLVQGARKIVKLARVLNISLLYANTVRGAFYTALAAAMNKCPFIWHMRDFWLSETKPGFGLGDALGKRILCSMAAQVVANSHATSAHLPSSSKVTVIHNGIDPTRYPPCQGRLSFRHEYHIPGNVPVVGMVARMRPWKGHKRFLQAMAQVSINYPQAYFLIVGGALFHPEDSYPDTLKQLAWELGLGDRVIFTGHLDDVRPALCAMDVFVHPGDPEPFGLVILEAMASALPVVGFNHGALSEIILSRETGILVTPGDVAGLAGAVECLLADEKIRSNYGQNGRQRLETHFHIRNMVAKIEMVLNELTP
ncbi:MAG: glycosyltransferase family 4 protein [Chloroflexota bacterium]